MVRSIGNLFILGDSYSTFDGYIPQGYATYYKNEGPHYCTRVNGEASDPQTDVFDVTQTWWNQFVRETDADLLQNCSWSGTTVCHTGYDGRDTSANSFIGRLDMLIEQGYFRANRVDTLIVFGGTNDSWANSPIGEIMYTDWKKEDLYFVLPAFCYMLHRLVTNLPEASLLCVINTELKPEITNGFRAACEHYGVDFVELNAIDKKCGHPTVKGMAQIKDQILDRLTMRS